MPPVLRHESRLVCHLARTSRRSRRARRSRRPRGRGRSGVGLVELGAAPTDGHHVAEDQERGALVRDVDAAGASDAVQRPALGAALRLLGRVLYSPACRVRPAAHPPATRASLPTGREAVARGEVEARNADPARVCGGEGCGGQPRGSPRGGLRIGTETRTTSACFGRFRTSAAGRLDWLRSATTRTCNACFG